MTSRRTRVMSKLRVGDLVIRRHRLLKTQGTVLRFDGEDENGASRAWIKWSHPNTLPNPSLEAVDDERGGPARPRVTRTHA